MGYSISMEWIPPRHRNFCCASSQFICVCNPLSHSELLHCPFKARYIFLPCQEWRDVLNSSSLTVASIISLRGCSASHNVPWLAGMALFFVSILWTFFCLNSEHRQQFYIFVILIMFFFTLFLSLVYHLMLLSWITVEHGCFKWWLLNLS